MSAGQSRPLPLALPAAIRPDRRGVDTAAPAAALARSVALLPGLLALLISCALLRFLLLPVLPGSRPPLPRPQAKLRVSGRRC